jgi:L-ascorbate metabolism protein UlaG (beta-lactamase superfamily)
MRSASARLSPACDQTGLYGVFGRTLSRKSVAAYAERCASPRRATGCAADVHLAEPVAIGSLASTQIVRSSMVTLTLIGGPTALVEYAGVRWLLDPAFSPPGEYGSGLVKTAGPALEPATLGTIDVVLLSHDQHADNLDPAGRELLPGVGQVLTTAPAAERLGGTTHGMEPWSTLRVPRAGGDAVTVTAVPAQHGPDGSEPVMGAVIGFVLAAPGEDTVYVSGDNASLDVVGEIVARVGTVDVAVLFAGAAQVPSRFDGAYLTLSSDRAAQATILLGARAAIPVHYEGWSHFQQGAESLRGAFAGNGVGDRLRLALPGETVTA